MISPIARSLSLDRSDFKLVCPEFLCLNQYPTVDPVGVRLGALVLNFPQRSCLGFYFT